MIWLDAERNIKWEEIGGFMEIGSYSIQSGKMIPTDTSLLRETNRPLDPLFSDCLINLSILSGTLEPIHYKHIL